jgi:hypothetical protein
MAVEPVVTGYRRLSGGDWQVTVSVASGIRVHVQIPAQVFHAGLLPALIPRVVERLRPPEAGG